MPPKLVDTIRPALRAPATSREWSGEAFARAAFWHSDGLIRPSEGDLPRRGRPRLAHPKRQVTLRLDAEVLDRFRETGPGWQRRINAALRQALEP